jgi:hypothetical protein
LALATKLTKYSIVNSIQVRIKSTLGNCHTEKSWTHLRERSRYGKEITQLIRGHRIVATVGVVATPAPTPNVLVTVLSESVPAEKWQWGMLASCSL